MNKFFSLSVSKELRKNAVDWMIEIVDKYQLHHYTLHLAVIVFDKYLAKKNVAKNKIHLIAITSLFIASKIEEIYSIDVDELGVILKNYTKEEFVATERKILKKLDFFLYYFTVPHYLDKYKKNMNQLDYHYSLYVAATLLLEPEYIYLDPEPLATNIIEFVHILQLVPFCSEKITYNPMFCYLYSMMMNACNGSQRSVIKYFSNKKYDSVALKEIPYFVPLTNICIDKIDYYDNHKKCNIYKKRDIKWKKHISNLGNGTFGEVSHVKLCGRDIALKKMVSDDDIGIDFFALREINSLNMLDHSNIIKMDGFYYDKKMRTVYLGMELMDKNLHSKMLQENISMKTKINYIIQILEGVKYLHEQNIMHRDLSVNNILVSSNNIIKICDFGSSRFFRHPDCITVYSTEVCCLYFRAFELLLKKSPYTMMIDVWSVAHIIGYILDGNFLITADNELEMIKNIFAVLGTPTKDYHENVTDWPNFDKSMEVVPKKGFKRLEKNFPNQTSILYQMMEYDPEKRINIAQALELFKASFAS